MQPDKVCQPAKPADCQRLAASGSRAVRFESQSSPPFAMEELTRENIANVAKATTPATKASATSRPVPAPSSSGISRSFTWQDLQVDGPARQQAIMTNIVQPYRILHFV